MHSCREASEHAVAMLDRKLGLIERLQLRLHLRMCAACRRYATQVKRVSDALRTLPATPLPAQEESRLIEALLRARQEMR